MKRHLCGQNKIWTIVLSTFRVFDSVDGGHLLLEHGGKLSDAEEMLSQPKKTHGFPGEKITTEHKHDF